MSAEPSISLVEQNALRDSLAQISVCHNEFHQFFPGVFDQLGTLSTELVRRQRMWQSEREQTQSGFQQQVAQLEKQRVEVAAEWERVQKQAKQNRSDAVAATGNDEQVKQILEQSEQERAALRGALEAAQSQAARFTEVTEELAHTRAELAEARRETQQQREQFESVRTEAAQPQADPKLQEQLQRLERERAELDRERTILETELESVRNRAADLSETLADHRKQMADERAQWTDELKRMRCLLEGLTRQQAPQEAAPPPPQVEMQVQQKASTEAASGDTVLDSVMAQFEMLQKDLARRRKKNSESKQQAVK